MIVQLGQYSSTYAAAFAGRVLAAAERLEPFPLIGRIVPEYELESVHELLIDSYRMIYLVGLEEVQIVALVHASQNLIARLGDNPLDAR